MRRLHTSVDLSTSVGEPPYERGTFLTVLARPEHDTGEDSGPGIEGTIRFTIVDTTSHGQIAAFDQPAGFDCAIGVYPAMGGTQQLLQGAEIADELLRGTPACSLREAVKPTADGWEIVASFAGDARYAPSSATTVLQPSS